MARQGIHGPATAGGQLKIETWLPLLALVLGWGLSQVTEVLKDTRTSHRERLARQADLQRSTLLDLQDTLLALSNQTRDVRFMRFPEILWDEMSEAQKMEASTREHRARARLWDTWARVELLTSRVLDAEARHRASSFVTATTRAIPMGDAPPKVDLEEVDRRYGEVIFRLGELIRERY